MYLENGELLAGLILQGDTVKLSYSKSKGCGRALYHEAARLAHQTKSFVFSDNCLSEKAENVWTDLLSSKNMLISKEHRLYSVSIQGVALPEPPKSTVIDIEIHTEYATRRRKLAMSKLYYNRSCDG